MLFRDIDWLVVLTILKNMKVNGKDVPDIMENTSHVPNHQPVEDMLASELCACC